MGTKLVPDELDCYLRAKDDEPMFILLARDKAAPAQIREWVAQREAAAKEHGRSRHDLDQLKNALQIADDMEKWRVDNYGSWWQCY